MMNSMFLDGLAGSPRAILALDVVVKATVVLAMAGAATLGLRRGSAAARHLAWCLGLGAALALPALSLALPGWSWRILPIAGERPQPARFTRVDLAQPRPAPVMAESYPGDERALGEDELMKSPSAAGSSSRSAIGSPILARSGRWGRLPAPSWSWLWMVWLGGALAVLAAPLAGQFAVRRLMREARPIDDPESIALLRELATHLGLKRPILLVAARAVMPMTWGWIRPVVLLPTEAASWGVDRRRGVLLHELAHVKRLDCLTQAIARAACAVYWFHPLAWVAAQRMRVEREQACDDAVLLQSGARASEYAGHLLEIARALRTPRAVELAALAMARPSQLEGRLLAIVDPKRRRNGPGRGMTLIAVMTATLILVPLATLHLGTRASATSVAAMEPIADDQLPVDASARMTVTGRVTDPSGKPLPNAAVMVIVRSKYAGRPWLESTIAGAMTTHEGRSDNSGQFRIDAPRTSSARQYDPIVTALAPGNGLGWAELDPDADPPVVDVALRTELIVHGRMFDVKGEPVPGVALRNELLIPVVRGTTASSIVRPDFHELHHRDYPAWPGPAVSDDQGRFTLRGLSRDLLCRLVIDDPRFAIPVTTLQTAEVVDSRTPLPRLGLIKVDPGPKPRPIAITLQASRTIVGRVTHADDGRPVPHALVASGRSHSEADAEGRFRIATDPVATGRFGLRAQSPAGAPYLETIKQSEWPKGAIEQSVDIALPRGVVVQGKVTEAGTGRPVAGAVVRITSPPPPRGGPPPGSGVPGVTGPDGTYRVSAPAGPGYVVVQGPDDDFVLQEFGGEGGVYAAGPGRRRFYAHAYRAVDLKPGGPDHEVDLTLRRGVALRGRAVGPDGQPPRDAWVCSRLMLRTQPDGGWKMLLLPGDHSRSQLRDGRFVLHGLDQNAAVEVLAYFLDAERMLGAVARFSGRSGADGPVTVHLEPCGTARARLVGADGKPLGRYAARALASMVITPGPLNQRRQEEVGPLFGDEVGVTSLDPVNYRTDFQSDAQGNVALPALIPGASYRIEDFTPAFGGGDPTIRNEFTVKPGETVDLGDVLIARPQGRD